MRRRKGYDRGINLSRSHGPLLRSAHLLFVIASDEIYLSPPIASVSHAPGCIRVHFLIAAGRAG